MTKQEIAAKLREALQLMNDSGAHWVQGEYEEDIGEYETAYCSLGAIRHVVQSPMHDPSPESDELAFALADVLPVAETEGIYASDENRERQSAYERIVLWNDADEREWDEIVEKFEEAARRLEA